jgi:biopolymer transport protein TolR
MGMARLRYLEQGLRPSLSAHRRTAKRQLRYYCWMDVSALLAVFLVIFIVLAIRPVEGMGRHGVGVDLFQSMHSRLIPSAIREDALRVALTRDGKVYFASSRIFSDELPDRLRDGVHAGAEDRVYLLVDSRAKYGDVKPALNQIGLSGVRNISFLTEPVPAKGAKP